MVQEMVIAHDKVCLTSFIYGEKYQYYIPLLLYSCHKAYPEYDIVLFVYGKLIKPVSKIVDSLDINNVRIVENSFEECKEMTPLRAQTLRWVLWDNCFLNYDYIYIVDIDMLYMREPEPLHKQHVKHMSITGLPYDNIRRPYKRNVFDFRETYHRIEKAGAKSIFRYFFGEKCEYRATGLHFIAVEQYYRFLTPEKLSNYRKRIVSGAFLSEVMYPNDEAYLYKILQNEGLTPEKMSLQTNPINMLDFNHPEHREFRPHHGIHMSLFKKDVDDRVAPFVKLTLECSPYQYYFNEYQNIVMNDEIFGAMLKLLPHWLQEYFVRLNNYIIISTNRQR